MKLTLDEALIRFILKNHRNLIFVSLCSVFVILLLSFITFNRLVETQTKLVSSTAEITKLKSSFAVSTNLIKVLKDKAPMLSTFLPNDFDLLLMLQTIEEIGNKTDFKIQSVALNSEKTAAGALHQKNILITASGTFDSFLGFLKDYKGITGQIISMASVSLSGKEKVISNLAITMYAYKPQINLDSMQSLTNLDKRDRKVLDIVTKYAKVSSGAKVEDNYDAKKNPFLLK